MGRKAIIREAILIVLKSAESPLRFKDIKEKVAQQLNRKKEDVGDQNISYNLSILIKEGQVEESNINGKNAYCLSNSFYKVKNKMTIKTIVDKSDLEEFYPQFESNKNPPVTAYFDNLETLMDPLRGKPVQHFSEGLNDWSDPLDLINRRMLETFTDLDTKERRGIAKMLAHAYWFGTQSLVKNFGLEPLSDTLLRSKEFAVKCIKNAEERKDSKRIEAENKIIEILDITSKTLRIKNLGELFLLFEKEDMEVKKLQNQLLSLTGQFMAAGETIYDRFKEFHSRVLIGLEAADLIPQGVKRENLSKELRYLMNYGDVWDNFFSSIISQFLTQEELESVNGDLDQTLTVIKNYGKYLFPLMDLPFRSKMFVMYFWGYQEVFDVSNRDFLPMFEEWLAALKSGHLDHRSWIFDEKAITKIIDTLNNVKKGKVPSNGIIDMEPWTIDYLYQFHPRGKDATFWRDLLVDINARLQINPQYRKMARHVEAVLEGGY